MTDPCAVLNPWIPSLSTTVLPSIFNIEPSSEPKLNVYTPSLNILSVVFASIPNVVINGIPGNGLLVVSNWISETIWTSNRTPWLKSGTCDNDVGKSKIEIVKPGRVPGHEYKYEGVEHVVISGNSISYSFLLMCLDHLWKEVFHSCFGY